MVPPGMTALRGGYGLMTNLPIDRIRLCWLQRKEDRRILGTMPILVTLPTLSSCLSDLEIAGAGVQVPYSYNGPGKPHRSLGKGSSDPRAESARKNPGATFFVRPDEILDKVIDEFLQPQGDWPRWSVGQNKGSTLDGLNLFGDMGGMDHRLEPMADALAVTLGLIPNTLSELRGNAWTTACRVVAVYLRMAQSYREGIRPSFETVVHSTHIAEPNSNRPGSILYSWPT